MIDTQSKSYPFLGVAMTYDVPYGAILAIADDLDAGVHPSAYLAGDPPTWMVSAVAAWHREQNRRGIA
jgi:hypothetical protein